MMRQETEHERRVVVTGIGAVTPVGLTARASWEAVIAGESGIGPITHFDTTDFDVKIAGEVKGFDAEARLGRKRVHRLMGIGASASTHPTWIVLWAMDGFVVGACDETQIH